MAEVIEVINIDQIKKMIPHRAPILLIDRVEDVVLDSEATGIKAVSGNEPYFAGHFPDFPVMPGVLIVEALAQTAAVLVAATMPDLAQGKLVFFTTIEKARFRQPVRPGDVIKLHAVKNTNKGPLWKFTGKATVDGKLVAEADFGAMIVDPDR
ncbi:MAG: 3-hydroxyacyl-ACP dehydratase FabZ [Candidatus Puniceispirillaceae bacterium]|jgi:3-hydroxyacyl-[acyl-carrier-protein] dehydratase|nr:3-hydroxyacyl-ACP dehydratase FabZ [Candidatus Puniceispirillum sp.]